MATVVDLPGIYSLSPYTSEEIVTRDFLIKEKPDGIINIVDATNIERNLYLSMQLIELNIPMVIALNMMDEVRANGSTDRREQAGGGAGRARGSHLRREKRGHRRADRARAARRHELTNAAQAAGFLLRARCTAASIRIAHIVEDHAEAAGMPRRFAATKLVEGDEPMMDTLHLSENEVELIGHTVTEMEGELGTDREAALADMRYAFIEKLCAQTVVKKRREQGASAQHAAWTAC